MNPSLPSASSASTARLASLRQAMQRLQIDALILPSSDPHLSEYLPAKWKGREWLSGSTGSAGTMLVTAGFSGLWTDARYWSQADIELRGSGITLMKAAPGAGMQHIQWLAANLGPGQTVAVDEKVLGIASARHIKAVLDARGIVVRTDLDLLDEVWNDRPGLPGAGVFEHEAPYARLTRAEKLKALRLAMAAAGANSHFISTLDDIAYLFNLRGADLAYNPVFLAHALVTMNDATLFVGEGKLSLDLRARLAVDSVFVASYAAAAPALASLDQNCIVLVDPSRMTAGMRAAIGAGVRVIESLNPTTISKSRKTDSEIHHVRATMEQDGAALCEFFAWLESTMDSPQRPPLTEVDIDREITAARARRPGFVSRSFPTVAGFNANGAVIHYRATQESHARIEGNGLLLIDSGGQYLGGTTDITRVVAVGDIDDRHRRDFTLVLKGLIALSSAQFPRGTRSPMLDSIARAPIWAAAVDYGHGTGHGVGYFLNVHEGPQSISPNATPEPHTAMEAGMITSIEPGIYREGKWGVRLENLVLNRMAAGSEFGEFLQFETLTLCPIDTRCLDLSILRPDERRWLDSYHEIVRTRLAPHVSGAAATWLSARTAPIGGQTSALG
jgi:Xaa-Pro aminopeptidase